MAATADLDSNQLRLAASMAGRETLEELVRLQGERVRGLKQQKASTEQVRPRRQGREQGKAREDIERGWAAQRLKIWKQGPDW